MPLTAGTRVGTYEITAPIGAGGMGEVYRANHSNLAEIFGHRTHNKTVPFLRHRSQ